MENIQSHKNQNEHLGLTSNEYELGLLWNNKANQPIKKKPVKLNRQIYYNMSERNWDRSRFLEPIEENKTIENQIETSRKVLELVTNSGLSMTQVNGQRKLGPPPGWTGPVPDPECEVFVGKLPRNIYEDEIYPIFKKAGEIYEIRLMMDFSGSNRGYCFVMYTKLEYAKRAIKELNNYEIRPDKKIGVVTSYNNCRLFVSHLPHDLDVKKFIKKICKITGDVGKVIVYRYLNGDIKNALILYNTHIGAAMARRRLVPDRDSIIEGIKLRVDWADLNLAFTNVIEESGVADENGHVETTIISIIDPIPQKNVNKNKSFNENLTSYLDENKNFQQKTSDSRQSSKNFTNKNFSGRKIKKLNKWSISTRQRSSSESDLNKGMTLNSVLMKPLLSKMKDFNNDCYKNKIGNSSLRNCSSNSNLSRKFSESQNLSETFNNPTYHYFNLENKENNSLNYQNMYSSNPVISLHSQHFLIDNNHVGSGSLINLNSQCPPGESFYNNKSVSVENFLPYFKKYLNLNSQPNYAGNGFLNTLTSNRFNNDGCRINRDNNFQTNLTPNQNKFVQLNLPNSNWNPSQQNVSNTKMTGSEAQTISVNYFNQNQIPNHYSGMAAYNNTNYRAVPIISENEFQYTNDCNENNQNFLNNFNGSENDCNCYNINNNYNQGSNVNNTGMLNTPKFDTKAFGLGKVQTDFTYSHYPKPILIRSLSENVLF